MTSPTIWVEITPDSKHGVPPVLVDWEDRTNHTGFISVYGYPDNTAEWIRNNWSDKYKVMGSMVGLTSARMPVWSNRLYVDFDENPRADAKKLSGLLEEANVAHTVWTTGGRSIHIHIECEEKCDWRVPHSQKVWMAEWAAGAGCKPDLSIYHAAGLYRMPGTLHQKTGQPKELLARYEGGVLDYDLVDSRVSSEPADKLGAERSLWRLGLVEKVASRHMHIYKLASQATRLGWPEREIEKLCLFWNNRLRNPLPEKEVLEKAYRSMR